MRGWVQLVIDRIESHLSRIALDFEHPAVTADDGLPIGWVRLQDDSTGESPRYGPAVEVLAILADLGELPEGGRLGMDAAWTALEGFPDDPESSDVWKGNHEFAGLDFPGELGLIAFPTNAGIVFGFAPTGDLYSACSTTHDYSKRYPTVSEAKAAAEFHAATGEIDR